MQRIVSANPARVKPGRNSHESRQRLRRPGSLLENWMPGRDANGNGHQTRHPGRKPPFSQSIVNKEPAELTRVLPPRTNSRNQNNVRPPAPQSRRLLPLLALPPFRAPLVRNRGFERGPSFGVRRLQPPTLGLVVSGHFRLWLSAWKNRPMKPGNGLSATD